MPSVTNKKIKAAIFDFGGVIELYEGGRILDDISRILNVSYEELRSEYFRHNHLTNVHNHRWEDTLIKVASIFDERKEKGDEIRAFVQARALKRYLNTELLTFVPALKKLGLKVGIFSNSNSELRGRVKEYGLQDLMDVLVISGEIGFQKPHKEAFEVLFKKLKMQPEEVVFIDDTTRSLEKAREIGYVPILFKNNEQLKADLRNLGIHLT